MQPHHGGPYRLHPPGPQTKHHQLPVAHSTGQTDHASEERQDDPFSQKYCANSGGGKTDRLQHTDLAQPLLYAEFEEERRQEQRRNHEKETEVKEILAKVRSAARSFQALGTDRHNGEAHLWRIQRSSEFLRVEIHRCNNERPLRSNADRSQAAKTRTP